MFFSDTQVNTDTDAYTIYNRPISQVISIQFYTTKKWNFQ